MAKKFLSPTNPPRRSSQKWVNLLNTSRCRLLTAAFALLFTFLILAAPQPARADGIIIPEPMPCPGPGPCPGPSPMVQLDIRYHRVTVNIHQQVAVTHVDQVFYNPNEWDVEGTYIFPIPAGAVVTSFTLWVDGKPVEGKVLDADEARQTYHEIVNSLKDPALLEYVGRDAVQASIFPIPSKGERRIELEYSQVLAAEEGLVRYVYPLSTEKFSASPLEQVSIQVEVESSDPIRAVYSPSHPVAIQRQDDQHFTASYEASHVLPETDFSLYYSLGETEAFHLLSVRGPADLENPDGYFLMLLAPKPELDARPIPKNLILVLDHSGSMEGEKFTQALEAARYILRHLNPEDRFNIVGFSNSVETYASDLRPAADAPEAIQWLDRLSAAGGTDIHRALLEAAAMADQAQQDERSAPTYLIFMTDGLPTEGVVESEQILTDFQRDAPSSLRLFAFGVGYDVDTLLLDTLAADHHGTSFYVQPGEKLDEALSSFYARISTPVLFDLEIDFGGMAVYDLYPNPLPDLFHGSQIIVVGRYRDGGETDVRLTGTVNDSRQVFHFPDQGFSKQSDPDDPLLSTLPRLWATRKIGYLLNQVRLNGADEETVDQIVRLSIRYGIVTPYTSYLVTEDPESASPLGEEAKEQIVELEMQAYAEPQAVSGESAVRKAADQGAMADSETILGNLPADESGTQGNVRKAGNRAFILVDGAWVDTAFDPDKMQTVKVAFLSDDYFDLLDLRPDLAAAFALGQRVIALSGETAYEVVAPEELGNPETQVEPLELPDPLQQEEPGEASDPSSELQPGEGQAAPGEQAANKPGEAGGILPCLGSLLPLALMVAIWMWRNKPKHD